MENQIKNLSVEQLLKGIENGTFLTREELQILYKGRELQAADNQAMTDAYISLRQFDENPENDDVDHTIDMDDVRGAMYDYAYNNNLEFDSSTGKFWEPSHC